MSDSYERSYYEIALTNGQVLVALGILLGCVLGAFLSGMWVAKKALDERPIAAAAEPVARLESPEEKAFEFFGGPEGDEGGALQVGEPAESSASPPQPEIQQPEIQQLRPLPGAASPTASQNDPPARPRVDPGLSAPGARAGIDSEAGDEQPASTAGERTDVEPAPLSEVPVIQVFSSNDQAQASGLVERLRGAGYRAFLSPVEVDGRTMYRVRVGPFTDRREAETQAEKVKREFKLDTWITNG